MLKYCRGNLSPGDLIELKNIGIWIDPDLSLHEQPNFVQRHPEIGFVVAISDDLWIYDTAALVLIVQAKTHIMGWISTKTKNS